MIRPLNSADLDVLYDLRQEALERHPASFGSNPDDESEEWMADRMREKNREDVVFGYFEDERLVGMIGLKREQQKKKQHKTWIWGLYVTRDYRNRKIGRKLMETCIDRARNLEGVQAIVLSVTNASARARNLYEKLDFKVWGIEPNALLVDGTFYDELHLKLTL